MILFLVYNSVLAALIWFIYNFDVDLVNNPSSWDSGIYLLSISVALVMILGEIIGFAAFWLSGGHW
jgi:hypothetical protein